MARITEAYVPGKGDDGYSEVMRGTLLRKDHAACHIQGSIESLRHAIELVVCRCELQQPELLYLLNWFNKNLFSFATYCYSGGENKNHCLPIEVLDFLAVETVNLKSKVGDCQDFLSQSHHTLILLDGVRIAARELERWYTAWRYCDEVFEPHLEDMEWLCTVAMHSAIFNRLSAYLFEATRMEAKLLREAGFAIEERPWAASIEPFTPFGIEV